MARVIRRNGNGIGDQVIDEIGAHRARVTEPADLDPARAAREYSGARTQRITLQVDQDVEIIDADAVCGDIIRVAREIDEMLAGGAQAGAHRTVVFRTVGVSKYF